MHLPAAQCLPEVSVIAAADSDADRLEAVANRFDIARQYAHYSQLLDDADVEAVVVCVPLHLHAEIGLAALDAGKHLLLEKPIAISLEEADQLIAQAAKSPSVAMVGFNFRWHRLIRQARKLLLQGRLGTIKAIHSVLSGLEAETRGALKWRKRREHGGGMLLDGAIHHFDVWRFLLQDEVEEAFAVSHGVEVDDEVAVVAARMASGALAAGSYAQGTGTGHEIEVFGSEGHLQISVYRFDGLRIFPISSRPGYLMTRLNGIGNTLRELPRAFFRRSPAGELGFSFQNEWRHFIDCIRRGTPVECSLIDGRCALEIALAAAESASNGQPVKIADAPNKIAAVNHLAEGRGHGCQGNRSL
jgi:predicted dehydrogenase